MRRRGAERGAMQRRAATASAISPHYDPPMPGSPAIRMQNRAIRRLREAGALSPDRAVSLSDLGIHVGFAVGRLIDRGVIVPSGPKHYLDEQATERFLVERRRRVLVLLVCVLVLMVAVMFFVR